MNAILDTGTRAYGPDFVARMNETVERLRGTSYRVVQNVYLRPSRDLALVAAECLDEHRPKGIRGWLSDATLRYAVHGIAAEADLLSYLYFDRCYAEHLIELGRADAEAQADTLVAFFENR
jgi:NTE family protein